MSNIPQPQNRRVLTWLRMFSGPLQRAYTETSDADMEELVQILAAGRPATPNSGGQTSAEVGDKPGNES